MRFGLVLVASLIAVGLALSVQAAQAGPVFTFSFVVTGGDSAPGTVTGEIFGLTDNATSAATDVIITGLPGGGPAYVSVPPIDIFASSPSVNSNAFTVLNGEVTSGAFSAWFGPGGDDYLQLEPGTGAQGFPGDLSFQDPVNFMNMWSILDGNTAPVSYSLAPVPEPSSIAVVGMALFGLTMARRGRHRIGIRLLPKHTSPVGPDFGAPAHTMQGARLA